MNLFNQADTLNFHDFNAHKIQAKTHSTIPQNKYIAKFHESSYCPSYTMPNSLTIQKCLKSNITTWSTIPCKISTRANNHQMKISEHEAYNKTWNQQISQQRNQEKEKLTLKSILECGAWVLGSWRGPSSSFHSRDGWYCFPLKVRKEGPQEDAIVNAKKNGGLEMGFKNGFVVKKVKNTKI